MIINNTLWSLVIQRVTAVQVDIWVGSLFSCTQKPYAAKIEVKLRGELIAAKDIADWLKPFSALSERFYQLSTINNLQTYTDYTVDFSVQLHTGAPWVVVQQGKFTTLPNAIPEKNTKPFTLALGSCFSNQDDHGCASQAFAALYDKGNENVRPDITFLVGDQVYLDIGFTSLIPFKSFIRNRIANRYAKNWQALADIFRRGATWMLPDDHEYWNDYPFNDLPIIALYALKNKSVRDTWASSASDAVANIQSAQMVEIINIGNDLSICSANLRTERAANQFISDVEFKKMIDWATQLTCPGVLIVQQLLMDVVGEGERNLPSFKAQYQTLIEALAASGNDILVLSGDVHFGRVASVDFGTKGATLTEICSSPLSNLRGLLNGFAADVANNKPERFPVFDSSSEAAPTQLVKYSDRYKVSHQKGRRWSVHPVNRTDEHFMTLSFSKLENNSIELVVNAWKVRQLDELTGLPMQGFQQVFVTQLKKHGNFN